MVVILLCLPDNAQEHLGFLGSRRSQRCIAAFLLLETPTFFSIAVQWVALTYFFSETFMSSCASGDKSGGGGERLLKPWSAVAT